MESINGSESSEKRRHDGEWIAAEWVANRLRPLTGIWSCCGHLKRVSLFCPSDDDRETMQQMWREKRATDEEAARYKAEAEARRAMVEEQLRVDADYNEFLAARAAAAETEIVVQQQELTGNGSASSGGNAAMVLLWTHKCIGDEFLVQKSADQLLEQTQTQAAMDELMKHDCGFTMLTVLRKYPRNASIVKAVASSLHNLLASSLTAAQQLLEVRLSDGETPKATTKTKPTRSLVATLIDAVLLHQGEAEVLVPAFNALSKAAKKGPAGAVRAAVEESLIEYAMAVCQIHKRDDRVLGAAMRLVAALCENSAGATDAVQRSVNAGALSLGVHVIKRRHNRGDAQLLCAAVELLQLLVSRHRPHAAEYMLRKNLVSQLLKIEKTIHALPDNAELHVRALQLTKQLSLHPTGAEQIDAHRGGWQALGAFTSAGDELLHMLPGHMHNPGWTIGETQYLPRRERQRYGREDPMPEANFAQHWTASSLNQYMGLSMKPITLPEEVDSNRFFFELIKLLGLLPHEDEDKEDWFKRVKAYERSNNVVLAEVIEAVRHVHHTAPEMASGSAAESLAAAAEVSDEAVEFQLMSALQKHRPQAPQTDINSART